MVRLKSGDKEYEDTLAMLKAERPDVYAGLRAGYREQRKNYPALSEQQYLILVLREAKESKRKKLERVDPTLTSEEEIARLQQIIESSPALLRAAKRYSKIQDTSVSSYLTKNEKKKLERKVAEEIHEELGEEDKRKYTVDRLVVIMPKLNLGPWIHHSEGGDSEDYGDVGRFIARNREVFQSNEEVLEKILERHYLERMQPARTIKQAREILKELKP